MKVSTILVVIAIVLFAIASIQPLIGRTMSLNLVAAGLFFWALSTVV